MLDVSSNRLKLNTADKTELLWLGSRHNLLYSVDVLGLWAWCCCDQDERPGSISWLYSCVGSRCRRAFLQYLHVFSGSWLTIGH